MRRFKHITREDIAIEQPYSFSVGGDYIPKWIIEHSNDWIEIEEEGHLVTCKDGVGLNRGDVCFIVYDSFIINEANVGDQMANKKIYSSRQAAEQYVLDNKPCLSLSDLKKVMAPEDGKMNAEIFGMFNKLKAIGIERILPNL